jgi:hypothetical protein
MIKGADLYYSLLGIKGDVDSLVVGSCFVESLHWFEEREATPSQENPQFRLALIVDPPIGGSAMRLIFGCKGVCRLTIKDFSNPGIGKSQFGSLSIRDVSSAGWENVRWEIEDYEEGKIRFFARDVEILSALLVNKC